MKKEKTREKNWSCTFMEFLVKGLDIKVKIILYYGKIQYAYMYLDECIYNIE